MKNLTHEKDLLFRLFVFPGPQGQKEFTVCSFDGCHKAPVPLESDLKMIRSAVTFATRMNDTVFENDFDRGPYAVRRI
jgi:hypothetical protein